MPSWDLAGNNGTSPATFLGTTDNQPLVVKTNNQEALRVIPGGNVGIGTQAPGVKLEIANDNAGANPQPVVLAIQQQTNTGANTDSNALMQFFHANGANSRQWKMGTGSNTLFGHPDNFGINDSANGPAGSYLVITPQGNVGVGTKTPGVKLEVAGRIHSTVGGFVFPDGSVQGSAAAAGPQGPQGLQGPPGPAVHTTAVCAAAVNPLQCAQICQHGVVAQYYGGACEVTADTGSCTAQNANLTNVCCVCVP